MSRERAANIGLDDPNSLAHGLLNGAATLAKLQHGHIAEELKATARNALQAWHHLFELISREKGFTNASDDNSKELKRLRKNILNATQQPEIPSYLASAMEQLLDHVDTLIAQQKSEKIKQIFPALSPGETHLDKMLISQMTHYRLCATCLDCNETIFKDLRVPQIVILTGRDAPWSEFKVKCQTDRTHTVDMVARYDPRNETILPSYYRGAPLDPITD